MCDHTPREQAMVAIQDGVWCDPCLEPIIRALNTAGIHTLASCCGHGHRPGNIALADGRELVIARDWDQARTIDRLFPVDINGDRTQTRGDQDAQGASCSRGGFRSHRGNDRPHLA